MRTKNYYGPLDRKMDGFEFPDFNIECLNLIHG